MISLILSLLLALVASTTPVHAVTDTPSSPSSTIDESSIEESIQQRIKKAIEDNLTSAKKELGVDRATPRAVIGTAASLSENSINLQTNKGDTIQLILNSDTTLTKNGKAIKTSDISISDHLIAIGSHTTPQSFTVTRLIVYTPTPILFERKLSFVTLTDYTSKSRELETDKGSLKLGSKPRIFNAELTQLNLSDLEFPATAAIVTYTSTKTDAVTISRILILKQGLTLPSCGNKVCEFSCTLPDCKPESPETCPEDCSSAN